MHVLLLLTLISLPYGEARINGLADAGVTMADQPLALYVNPALITLTPERKLLFNPVGVQFGDGLPPIDERIFDGLTSFGYLGYTQPVNATGLGLGAAGFFDEGENPGILLGAAYDLGFLHAGASAGVRYLNYVPEGTRFRPAFALGIAVPGMEFADVPGEISVALAGNLIERFKLQGGLDYKIEFFRFLVNFYVHGLFTEAEPVGGTANLALLFDFTELIGFPLEFGGGWGSDNRYGVLLGADLNICRINLSYYNIPPRYSRPDNRLALSFLFNIASTREVQELLADITEHEDQKNKITSRTYTSQGIEFYNRGDYEASIHAFDVALIWDPTNDNALDWLRRVRNEKETQEFEALMAAARAALRNENYLEVKSKAEEALEIEPASADARSLAEDATQKYTDAIFTETSSSRHAGELNALYQRGLDQYAAGDYAAATETWNEIAELQPRSQTVATYQQQTSARITESVAEGRRELAELERRGRWLEALQLARRLKRMAPNDRDLASKISTYESKISTLTAEYTTQGSAFFNQGAYLSAQQSFLAVLSLEPNNATAKRQLELIELKLARADVDALYMQGVQAYTENRYSDAIKYWQQVLNINPNYPNVERNIQRAREKLEQLN